MFCGLFCDTRTILRLFTLEDVDFQWSETSEDMAHISECKDMHTDFRRRSPTHGTTEHARSTT